jgi:uncharacterized protein with HEPN domain
MKKDDTVYLRHILDAIAQIESYLQDVTHTEFKQKKLLQDGVIRQLEIEIIGEASRNLGREFQKEHSEIPWGQIIALRNRLIHAYFTVNLQMIWEVVKSNLPILKNDIMRILEE